MNSDQRLTTIASFVLMLATMAFGWMSLKDDFSAPRIPGDRSSGNLQMSEQDVTARLWEDPLQAVEMEVGRRNTQEGHKPGNLQETLRRILEVNKDEVCLMVVPIPETPFPDSVETRLRLRYSIQMALAREACVPDDRDHLGYVSLPWPGTGRIHSITTDDGHASTPAKSPQPADGSRESIPKTVDVPYEWFTHTKQTTAKLKLLVMWLPERMLADKPLCRLADLRQLLAGPGDKTGTRLSGPLVIGPRSSDTMRAMANGGVCKSGCNYSQQLQGNLCIFSPQATAPDALIGLEPSPETKNARSDMNRRINCQLGTTNQPYFKNFIAPDDQLTDLLVRELDLRGVNFQTDRILILAEADTSYGRSLPLAFEASLKNFRARDAHCNTRSTALLLKDMAVNKPDPPDFLSVVKYLRGLDSQKGFQGTQSESSKDRSRSAEQLLTEALNKKSAPAIGESQLDYAERLAEDLQKDALAGRAQVKAVGVLGGDIYDKLILLRSLRARFQEAVFFTTDLDARLWHPDHFKFTRNLVVASAHDVKVAADKDKDEQFKIAPFRDAYQAAVFKASVAAIAKAKGRSPGCPAPNLEPAIYEIGRQGAVSLQPADPTIQRGSMRSLAKLKETCRKVGDGWGAGSLEKLGITSERRRIGLLFAMALVMGGLVLEAMTRHSDPADKRLRTSDLFLSTTGWAGCFFLAAVLLLLLFAQTTNGMSKLKGAEPWGWFSGVSVWPTELVRLLIIASVAWMLTWSWKRHLRHREDLSRTFQLKEPHPSDDDKPFWDCITTQWPSVTPRPDEQATIEADAVFKSFCIQAKLNARCARAVAGGVIYFILALCLMNWFGMPMDTHIRGIPTVVLDKMILYVSIWGWLALVFYVLDAVLLSAQMLNRIGGAFTIWPGELLNQRMEGIHVREEDLEGYFDVRFAAEKTRETGKLVLLPFIIQFMMLLARNSYFDNWRWPPGLVLIFTGNILLSAIAWTILRRAAATLRHNALRAADQNLREVEAQIATKSKPADSPDKTPETKPPSPEVRKIGLLEIRRRIEGEHRGAYARWFQDPAFLAMLIPTGLLGILGVLFQAIFGLM